MWITVDMEGLRIIHKHPNHQVITSLVYLEAIEFDVCITSFDSPGWLPDLTTFELHKLYENICGKRWVGFQEIALRKAIAAAVDAIAVTDCDFAELKAQCDSLKNGDKERYRYVKGAKKPAVRDYDLASLCAQENPAFEYGPDAQLNIEEKSDRELKHHKEPSADIRRVMTTTIVRPTDKEYLEIWDALDNDETLNDINAIKTEAQKRKWNTLTAILQLSQWKKFKGIL